MPRLVSQAEYLSSHSDSSSPPHPVARRARNTSSASALALGARKSRSSSGHKAETAPARASGYKAKRSSSHVSGRKAKPASFLPPRPTARRARKVSSAPAVALGAEKSPPSSGCKAESAPTGPPVPKSAPASSRASASGPTFLGRRLCLRCAKFAESTPEHNCLFDKGSSKMCARCRALKSPCLPVSNPYSVLTRVLIWFRSLPVWPLLAASYFAPSASWLNLSRSSAERPSRAESLGLRPSFVFSRAVMPAKRPFQRGRKLWLRPTSKIINPPSPSSQ